MMVNQPYDGFKASRKEALLSGDKYFFTGIACKYGHLAVRRVDNTSCTQCMRDRRTKRYWADPEGHRAKSRDRKARLYAEDPEPFKQAERARRSRDPERFKAQAKQYYEKNKDHVKSSVSEYQQRNAAIIKKKKAEKYASLSSEEKHFLSVKRWKRWEDNPNLKQQAYEKAKIYRERNKALVRAHKANYSASKKQAEGNATGEQIAFLHILQEHKCFYCEEEYTDYHVDHMIPLSRGGTNDISNLAIACPSCNLRKHAKMPWVFLAEMSSCRSQKVPTSGESFREFGEDDV